MPESQPLRAVALVRMSTDRQQQSPVRQRELFRQYCEAWGLVAVGEYEDLGVSATHVALEDRPGIQAMLADAVRGRFDVVWCEEQSRASRDPIEILPIQRDLAKIGVALVDHSEDPRHKIDPAVRELIVGVRAVASRFEVRQLAGRVRRGQQVLLERGVYQGGRLPLGLAWDKAAGQWRVEPDGQAFAIRAFECFVAERGSTHRAAQRMAAEGWCGHRGGRLYASTIWHIVRQPAYRGRRRGLGQEWPADLPEVVPAELVAQADAWLESQAIHRQRNAHAKALFLGTATCPECGHYLSCVRRDRATARGEPHRYRCHHAHMVVPQCDWRRSIGETKLEAAVLPLLAARLRGIADQLQPVRQERRRATGDKQRAQAEAAQERLTTLYVEGRIGREEYERRADELAARVAAIPVEEAPAPEVSAAQLRAWARRLEREWPRLELQERRDLLQALLTGLAVNADDLGASVPQWRAGI